MRNPADTFDLRNGFANQFLASPSDHDRAIVDGPIELLITEFDAELASAKARWTHLDTAAEWAEMDRWLSERGYVDSEVVTSGR